ASRPSWPWPTVRSIYARSPCHERAQMRIETRRVAVQTRTLAQNANELPRVDLVLRRLEAQLQKQFGGIGGLLADHRNLRSLGRSEVLEHERGRLLAARRPADADAHAVKVVGAQC